MSHISPRDRVLGAGRFVTLLRAASGTLAVALGLAACASSTPPPASPSHSSTTLTSGTTEVAAAPPSPATEEGAVMCDLVCEQAKVVPRPADEPDYTAQAEADANRVLQGMHDDLLACYTTRLAENPKAYGYITVDILVGPDGRVRNVDTTGGALLGERAMSCIVKRIERATFDRPHGGGTLHIQAPFSLRKVAHGDDTL